MKKIIKSFISTMFLALCVTVGFASSLPVVGAAYLGIEGLSLLAPSGVLGINVYNDTVLQSARAFIKKEMLAKFLLRPNETRVVDLYLKDREFTVPNLGKLRAAETQTATALFLTKPASTLITAPSCTITGGKAGSDSVDLTWQFTGAEFDLSFKQHQGNQVSMQMAMAHLLLQKEIEIWAQIDAVCLANLESNRSAINNGDSGTFDSTNDIMAITNANKGRFYNLVSADMRMNNYPLPQYMEAHNTFWTAEQQYYINQGQGNSVNTAFQFGGFSFTPSNLITTGAIGNNTYNSVHYIVPQGGVALIDWVDPLNIQGQTTPDGIWSTYTSMLRPGFVFQVFKTIGCADTSALGGSTQDYVEKWQMGMWYSLAVQPTEGVNESPIFKYGVMSGDVYTS